MSRQSLDKLVVDGQGRPYGRKIDDSAGNSGQKSVASTREKKQFRPGKKVIAQGYTRSMASNDTRQFQSSWYKSGPLDGLTQ